MDKPQKSKLQLFQENLKKEKKKAKDIEKGVVSRAHKQKISERKDLGMVSDDIKKFFIEEYLNTGDKERDKVLKKYITMDPDKGDDSAEEKDDEDDLYNKPMEMSLEKFVLDFVYNTGKRVKGLMVEYIDNPTTPSKVKQIFKRYNATKLKDRKEFLEELSKKEYVPEEAQEFIKHYIKLRYVGIERLLRRYIYHEDIPIPVKNFLERYLEIVVKSRKSYINKAIKKEDRLPDDIKKFIAEYEKAGRDVKNKAMDAYVKDAPKEVKDFFNKLRDRYSISLIDDFANQFIQQKKSYKDFFWEFTKEKSTKQGLIKDIDRQDRWENILAEPEIRGDSEEIEIDPEIAKLVAEMDNDIDEEDDDYKAESRVPIELAQPKPRGVAKIKGHIPIPEPGSVFPEPYFPDISQDSCMDIRLKTPWLDTTVKSIYILPVESVPESYYIFSNSTTIAGETWYLASKEFFRSLCKFVRKSQKDDILTIKYGDNTIRLKIAYDTQKGIIVQDEDIFRKEREYMNSLHKTREEKISDMLAEKVTIAARTIAQDTLSQYLTETLLDMKIPDKDLISKYSSNSKYISTTIDMVSERVDTNLRLFEYISRVCSFLQYSGYLNKDTFRDKISKGLYTEFSLANLSDEDMLPEIYDDPKISDADKNTVSHGINTLSNSIRENMGLSLYDNVVGSDAVVKVKYSKIPVKLGDKLYAGYVEAMKPIFQADIANIRNDPKVLAEIQKIYFSNNQKINGIEWDDLPETEQDKYLVSIKAMLSWKDLGKEKFQKYHDMMVPILMADIENLRKDRELKVKAGKLFYLTYGNDASWSKSTQELKDHFIVTVKISESWRDKEKPQSEDDLLSETESPEEKINDTTDQVALPGFLNLLITSIKNLDEADKSDNSNNSDNSDKSDKSDKSDNSDKSDTASNLSDVSSIKSGDSSMPKLSESSGSNPNIQSPTENNLKFAFTDNLCSKCGNTIPPGVNPLKSIVSPKDSGPKQVQFCSFACFENTTPKDWKK